MGRLTVSAFPAVVKEPGPVATCRAAIIPRKSRIRLVAALIGPATEFLDLAEEGMAGSDDFHHSRGLASVAALRRQDYPLPHHDPGSARGIDSAKSGMTGTAFFLIVPPICRTVCFFSGACGRWFRKRVCKALENHCGTDSCGIHLSNPKQHPSEDPACLAGTIRVSALQIDSSIRSATMHGHGHPKENPVHQVESG